MAEEQIVTNIVAKSDFSNLIADLNKVTSALTNLQAKLNATNKNLASQVNVMNRSFAETMRSTGQYSTHFVNLASDVDKFGVQLDKGQIKLKQFAQIYQSHIKTSGGLVRQLAQQQVQLQNAILQPLGKNAEGLMQYNVHIPAGLDKVKNKSALARQELQIMNKVVQEGANSLINWGKNTQWAGRQLTVGLTLPLAAFGKASADAFRAADQELTRLTKVYGGLAATSAEELGKVRQDVTKTAAELSKAYGSSFRETIALGADIAATGKQGNELLGSIRETTRLAVLGEVDRQDAMKATLAIQSAFKSNTDELAESINFLNAVENQTSTTLNDLVEAIPKAGPIIKGLGGDVQDLALYLTAMREGGVSASEGANALKSGLASLINPTKVAKDMFAGFGISLTDIVQKNAGNTTETLLALQSALDSLNPLQKQQALEQLFGKFQFARMNALFENLGKQGSQTLQVMDLMKASSEDLANIAGRELSMVTESAAGKYKRALEGLKADLAGVGEQFLRINTYLINIVDGILQFAGKLPGPVKTILGLLGGFTAIAGPMIMLTGVLGNFFGYIIKGVSHMRALTKGGEGWKLLTPDILAANKAGGLVEQTFYSDAKASEILNTAINRLSASYQKLAADANNAMISTNPAISTTAGTLLMTNKDPRRANPAHSMIGPFGSRAAAHHNPRGDLSAFQRSQQTIHSITPQPELVNQAIKKNPQIFTYQDMPNIPGLTNIGGVSTGIVAGEAAKWHTLMSTLSMQTKQEVAQLEREIARTGTVSQEFMSTYSQILPAMTSVVDNAVLKSQQIIQKVQMGELQVDQARAKIIAINARLEADMIATSNAMAAQMSRTANLTGLPLTGQAIVDKTGKSNVREMFRDDRKVKQMMDVIARATGVRTSGGGYSIETTVPKKLNMGGYVYTANDGSLVPGPNINADVVPAMLTPGEFVVNAEATRANLPLLQALNSNRGSDGPGYHDGSRQGIKDKYAGRQFAHLDDNITINPSQYGYLASQFDLSSIGKDKTLFDDPRTAVKSSFVAAYDKWFNQGTNNGTLKIDDAISYLSGEKVNGTVHNPEIAYSALMDDLGLTNPVDRQQFAKDIDTQIVSDLKAQKSSGKMFLADKIAGKTKNQRAKTSLIGESITNTVKSKYPSKLPMLNDLKRPGEIRFHTGKGSVKSASTGKTRGPGKQRRSLKQSDLTSAREAAIFGGNNVPAPIMRGHGATMVAGIREAQQKKYNQQDSALLRAMRAGASRGRIKRKNLGGIIGMNAGGMVPGYQNGGQIPVTNTPKILFGNSEPYSLGSMEQPQQMMGMRSGAGIASMLGGSLAFSGGMAAGSKLGGGLGGMAGGLLASVAADSLIRKLMTVNKQGAATASIFGKLGPLMANPYVLAGTAIVGVTAGLLKLKKNAEESARINRLAFSGGVKPIKDFDSELKQVIKNIENTRVAAELLHAQMNSAGLPGVSLTIKEFSDLREKIKSTHPELVKLFKQNDGKKLMDAAAGIKAQFIAAGDSAEIANGKIAALLAESGKSGVIRVILGSSSVSEITDAKTAILSMINALSKLNSAKDKSGGMLQALGSMSDYINNATDKSVALKEQFNLIAASNQRNVMLTQDQIVEISKTNPVLSEMLDQTDTIATALAKWRIYIAGSTKDISSLNDNELKEYALYAEKIATYYSKIADVSSKEAQSNALTGSMAKEIDSWNKKQANAQKSATEGIQKQIDLKTKQIQQIKEEGDARKKALRDQQQSEDIKLQIQQEQLNYQQALAKGDMSGAAQAQINIQRLVGAQQLKVAEDAIDKAVQSKIDALQAQIDVLNKKSSVVSSEQSTNKPKESKLQSTYEAINSLLKEVNMGGNVANDKQVQRYNDLILQLQKLPNSEKYLQELGAPKAANLDVKDRPYGPTIGQQDISQTAEYASLKAALEKGASGNLVAGKIDTSNTLLKQILDKLPGLGSNGLGGLGKKTGSMSLGKDGKGGTANFIVTYGQLKEAGVTKKGDKFLGADGNEYELTEDNTKVKGYAAGPSLKKLAMGGFIKKYATAGMVSGPGTGTSDSIPAMLSNGEYVIRAAAVQSVGTSFLDGINRMSAGGIATKYSVPRMNMGGRVNMSNAGQASTSNALYNINVTLNGTELTADDVARTIEERMRRMQSKEGLNRVYS